MGLICAFTVWGSAVPQGSTKTWTRRDPRTGAYKPVVTHSNRPSVMSWRADIRSALQQQAPGLALVRGAVAVRAVAYFLKPVSVPKRRVFPTVAPDGDKLCRALGDALEHVLLANDSQIVHWAFWKVYTTDRPRMTVEVWEPDALTVPAGNPFAVQPGLFVQGNDEARVRSIAMDTSRGP